MIQLKHYIFLIIIITGLTSCNTKTTGQQVDNTKPMYGEVTKSKEHKEIDKDFKKECLEQFGSIDSSVYLHIDHAWRYFYNNDLKSAMKRFNQSWLLDPEYPDSYFGFAALLEMNGNQTESERFYKMGFEMDNSNTRAKICFQRIADCKEQLKDFNGTIDAYIQISELNPTNSFAFKKLGFFHMELQNTESALKAYSKAIELDPYDAMTYNNRAYLFQTNGDYKKAITDYTKAIELDSKYISAYVNRGITLMQENNFKAAKKDFETCIQLDSKTGELRRMLGMAKINLNDKEGACKDFEIARELGDIYVAELIKQNCN